MPDADLILKNATVIDATGTRTHTDVAIADGLITEVGPNLDTTRARAIDATDCIVAPGLVDLHTHLLPAVDDGVAEAGADELAEGARVGADLARQGQVEECALGTGGAQHRDDAGVVEAAGHAQESRGRQRERVAVGLLHRDGAGAVPAPRRARG